VSNTVLVVAAWNAQYLVGELLKLHSIWSLCLDPQLNSAFHLTPPYMKVSPVLPIHICQAENPVKWYLDLNQNSYPDISWLNGSARNMQIFYTI